MSIEPMAGGDDRRTALGVLSTRVTETNLNESGRSVRSFTDLPIDLISVCWCAAAQSPFHPPPRHLTHRACFPACRFRLVGIHVLAQTCHALEDATKEERRRLGNRIIQWPVFAQPQPEFAQPQPEVIRTLVNWRTRNAFVWDELQELYVERSRVQVHFVSLYLLSWSSAD